MSFIHRLWHDEAGATALEYAIILALAATVSVPSFEALGNNLSALMTKVAFVECQKIETICLMVAPN